MPELFLILIVLAIFFFVLPILAIVRSQRAIDDVAALRAEWNAFRLSSAKKRIPGGEQQAADPPMDPAPPMPRADRVDDLAATAGEREIPDPARLGSGPLREAGFHPPHLPILSKILPVPPDFVPIPNRSPRRAGRFSQIPKPGKPLNLEQFLGVKLFAWLGGFTLFLGIVFFVKYAFDNNLIPPAVRTGMGFLTGLSLTASGLWLRRKHGYGVMSRTLTATGMLVLYGVTFAAHALYKFPIFTAVPTFLLMAVITACSFVLAVRLQALEVAVLGMLGGFLAPVVCSTGQDNALALFTSTALLDIGLLAVANRCRWPFLATFAAIGTLLTQFGWMFEFFVSGSYEVGLKSWFAAAIFVVFPAIFCGAALLEKSATPLRADGSGTLPHSWWAVLLLLIGSFCTAFGFLSCPGIAARPLLLFGFVLALHGMVMAFAWKFPVIRSFVAVAGGLTFIHILVWTAISLTPALLPAALAVYLVFGLVHIGFPMACQRWQPGHPPYTRMLPWLPLSILILTLLPVLKQNPVPWLIWPFLLLANGIATALAARCRQLPPIAAAMGLTFFTVAVWLQKLPPIPASLALFLPTLVVFSLAFLGAGLWLTRKTDAENDMVSRWLPSLSAALPFSLLVMAVLSIPLPNPTPVFAVALLMAGVLLLLSLRAHQAVLGAGAAAGVLLLETAWHLQSFDRLQPAIPLGWYLLFHFFLTVWPFLFRRRTAGQVLPWAASALSGVGHFLLIHALMRSSWPAQVNGLLPLAFAVPALAGLEALRRGIIDSPPAKRVPQMAWLGGLALLFITLMIPIQLKREWLTLGWALEGAALCWLFRKIPHQGLRLTGFVLLTVAFVRMGLNSAVLTYHRRGGVPVLNWHLYGYGITAAAQFLGAWQLATPHHRWKTISLRGLLCAFGGILVFLLVNVQIADFFTPEGARFITFQFQGNFARDMTYSIVWGFFALGLLMIGFRWRQAMVRYCGMGLLVLTLLKLFLHDLAQLGTLHRIGAFVAVALTALAASFLYQRFLIGNGPAWSDSGPGNEVPALETETGKPAPPDHK